MEPRILSMEVDDNDDDSSFYRILLEDQVRYVEVKPHTLDRDTRSFPLVTILPVLRYHDQSPCSSPGSVPAAWTVATISQDHSNGQLQASFSNDVLPGVQRQWCSTKVSCLDLKRTKQLTSSAFEAILTTTLPNVPEDTSGQPCISGSPATHARTTKSRLSPSPANSGMSIPVVAKIARFDWEIPRIERETRAYQLLEQLRHKNNINLAPRFLGYLHEHGRVMGFIIEKIEGARYASVEDLSLCEAVVRDLHQSLNMLHGDVNRYNFLITEHETVKVRLIDFEHSEEHASVEAMDKEFDSLRDELLEDTRRGGGFCTDSDDEVIED